MILNPKDWRNNFKNTFSNNEVEISIKSVSSDNSTNK
jgi:hypothetical protein